MDARSAGLAVQGVTVVAGAALLHLETVGVVPTVLLRDVVPLLALRARERDLRADVRALAGHGLATSRAVAAPNLVPARRPTHRVHLAVAGAGLEPATPRL